MKPLPFVTITLLLLFGNLISAEAKEPHVKTLVPGLTVTRLPVSLKNINSVEYGPGGKLYAAGYDGRIYVLTDTNHDGLEDKVQVYWSKAGDLLTPVGILPTKEGIYISARGKVALLKDTNGDGRADKSEVVTSNWKKETHNSNTRNDAAGVTIDKEGNLYFSLGCMSYNHAWQLNKKGQSQYDIKSERGTILKVSPDRKQRKIFATGLRFVVGLEFNKHGDLFATDQEGDTWFPGGNPRDELLYIIEGRHYGFPFRHAKYLPNIIDEPYVVGLSPQHQSGCGFRFNETRSYRKPFGPASWEDNAIITGFSRGKLWRTPLAKTRAGYVGKQIQFIAFESLPTDVAVSPKGHLLVTCHSGHPDWGAGPAAKGHLYKIMFDRKAPQPIVAWASSPVEMKVAFDRPVNHKTLQNPEIEAGKFVWEGDRYEWIYPGYEVVKSAKQSLRRPMKASMIDISKDGRTVTFATELHPWRARYGITMAGVTAKDVDAKQTGKTIELSYDLGGVTAKWRREGETKPTWSGWLPHIDTNVIRTMTAGSSEHEKLLQLMKQPGTLTMQSQLLLPGKKVTFRFESNASFQIKCGSTNVTSKTDGNKQFAQFTLSAKGKIKKAKSRGDRQQILPTETVSLTITLQTGNEQPLFDASYHADYDQHERPLRLEHLFVPWASHALPTKDQIEESWVSRKMAGDVENGRKLFFGKEANCSTCHTFGNKGGKVAADLSVSIHRSPEAVLRDIVKPSAAINPDYVSYTVELKSGKVLAGLIQSTDQSEITLIDNTAKSHKIKRDDIEEILPSAVSMMPKGFEKLGKEQLQDLVALLCTGDKEAMQNGTTTGVILREYWLNVPGAGMKALTQHKNFPNKPTGTELIRRFEGPVNWKHQYGSRICGYVHPPKTGDYTFWLAADDHAELWLSSSEKPSDKKRIIQLDRWTRSRSWETYPEQKSKPIRLVAGKKYYIEALHHEATVDDCFAVGWQLPDGSKERPIPGKRLSTILKK